MAKYNKDTGIAFCQIPRKLWIDDKYKGLSVNAKFLYCTLVELEHRFTGKNVDFFFRSNELLAEDAGMSLSTLKRAKKELIDTDLIVNWNCHFIDKETERKSEKKVSAYRLL